MPEIVCRSSFCNMWRCCFFYMLYADVFCLLTHKHLKSCVFFGTLSRSQDQLLLQYDSATETEGLRRTLQQRLLRRQWTPATCNKARYVTEVQRKNRFILSCDVSRCECKGSYLPGTLRGTTAQTCIAVELVAGLSLGPLTRSARLSAGESV